MLEMWYLGEHTPDGCMDSVDWNGGMEWWNGLDWTGMEWKCSTFALKVRLYSRPLRRDYRLPSLFAKSKDLSTDTFDYD